MIMLDYSSEFILPITKKNIIPQNKLDRGLFILMVMIIPLITIWENIILFTYHSTFSSIVFLHLIVESVLLLNIIGNLYYLKRIDSSCKGKLLPTIPPPTWKYCHFCQINSPPRSYHCPICDECILKRDQHCMFTGCCVGFYNHRYYLMSLIYLMIGSTYAAIYQWSHCLHSIGGFHLVPILSLAAPHIAVLFGFITLYGFIVAIIQIILLLATILTLYLIFVQVKCITRGQTIHEKRAGIVLYDLGWKKNIIQVLGEHWYLALFNPFIDSPLKGDGINFYTFDDEDIKHV